MAEVIRVLEPCAVNNRRTERSKIEKRQASDYEVNKSTPLDVLHFPRLMLKQNELEMKNVFSAFALGLLNEHCRILGK